MTSRAIVLDANILVRAVLGSRVSELLAGHTAQVTFLAPDIAFDEVREHLPAILGKRGKSAEAPKSALEKLEALAHVIVSVARRVVRALQGPCAGTHRPARSGRLARARMCARGRLSDLD